MRIEKHDHITTCHLCTDTSRSNQTLSFLVSNQTNFAIELSYVLIESLLEMFYNIKMIRCLLYMRPPLSLKSSTNNTSSIRFAGDRNSTEWTVRSNGDQPSLWKTMTTDAFCNFSG
jgi:hypothetical protein